MIPIGDFSLDGRSFEFTRNLQADPADLAQTNTKIAFKVEAVANKDVTVLKSKAAFFIP